jgi:succinate dehydrogenase flavin-adding protein (antitoxin of CptAB toxin-antitoxin module)
MFQLDDNLLRELGLGDLPAEEKNKMLAHIYETLELRVGMKLAEKMTDAQLDEFESFIDKNDEEGALKWLETNFPNYKDTVAEELNKLKDEIKAQAPQIMQATMAQHPPIQQSPSGMDAAAMPSQPRPLDNNDNLPNAS